MNKLTLRQRHDRVCRAHPPGKFRLVLQHNKRARWLDVWLTWWGS